MSDLRLTRRQLFSGDLLRRLVARGESAEARTEGPPDGKTARTERAFPVLRPPGAVSEERFLELCARCHSCVDACSPGAVFPAPSRFRSAAGTPMIDPQKEPCWLCPDTPCATACPSGALVPGRFAKAGTAHVLPHACLAYRSGCSVCVERCPVEGALSADSLGRPQIDASRCSGCGICQYVCPAPETAVLVLPARDREELCPPSGDAAPTLHSQ